MRKPKGKNKTDYGMVLDADTRVPPNTQRDAEVNLARACRRVGGNGDDMRRVLAIVRLEWPEGKEPRSWNKDR